MASVRDTSIGYSTDNSSPYDITVTLPTHQSGDLLLIFLMFDRGDDDPTGTPSGWTQVDYVKSNNARYQSCSYLFKKIASSSSETNPTFTIDEVFEQSYKFVAIAIQDHNDIDIYGKAILTGTAEASINAPSVTTTEDNCLLIRAMCHKDLNASDTISSTPSTQLWIDDGRGGTYIKSPGHAGSYSTQTSAGSSGTASFSGQLYRPVAWTVAIKNASGTETNSERDAETKGKSTSNSERDSETTGKSTSNNERDAETKGSQNTNSTRGAETTGFSSYYWVGGTGEWSDTDHWSNESGGDGGAGVPTSADDVFIDSNSGFGSGGTISTDVLLECKDFTCNSGHSYTIEDTSEEGAVFYGDVVFETGITFLGFESAGPFGIAFRLDSGTQTITSNGAVLNISFIKFDSDGSVILQDDLEIAGYFYQDDGTFDANDHNIVAKSLIFSAGTDYTPTIYMGSGIWEITGEGEEGSINIEQYDNEVVTIIPETSTIKFTGTLQKLYFYDDTANETGKTFNNLWIVGTDTTTTIYGSNTFNEFKVTNPPHSVKFEGETTTTVNTFDVSGTSGNLITVNTQRFGGAIITYEIASAGSGYQVDDYVNVAGGDEAGDNQCWLYVATVDGEGGITSFTMDSGGGGYYVENGVAIESGSGSGATINILSTDEVVGQHNISKSSGTVNCEYLDISNSNASGGATWNAIHSLDTINNDGWIFLTNTDDERNAELAGKQTTNSERGSELNGKASFNSERGAEVTGDESSENSERLSEILGKDTTESDRTAKIFGKQTTNSERAAETTGKDTAESERGAETQGSQNADNTRGAETIGKDTSNSERSSEITGKVETDDERNVELSGIDTDDSSRNAEITGQASSINEREAEVTGKETANSERSVELSGIETLQSERGAELEGSEGANSDRNSEIHGLDTSNSERGAELSGKINSERASEATGKENYQSERLAELTGENVSESEQQAETTGKLTSNDHRQVEATGKAGEDSTRQARITGEDTSYTERDSQLTGKNDTQSGRNAELIGDTTSFSNRNAETIGDIDTENIRSAEITGESTSESQIDTETTGKDSDTSGREASLTGSLGTNPYSKKSNPYSKKIAVYLKKTIPYSRKCSPYSRKSSPYTKL